MKLAFADTSYWIALLSPRDEWHAAAVAAGPRLGPHRLLTTDEVLIELVAFFSRYGQQMRRVVVDLVESLQTSPGVLVLPQSRQSFERGLSLLKQRLDKQYSLTDCISMATMRVHQATEVLTHDRHFEQEGFAILLQK